MKLECHVIRSNLTNHMKVDAGIATPLIDNGLCGAEVMLRNIHGLDEMFWC